MEEDKQITNKYINTPFAYAKAQKGLTLLQQNVMVRVIAHLQNYIDKYFKNPQLRASDEDPKPLMTVEDRDNFPPVRIELSELGISSSSYSRVRAALKEVLSVTVEKNTHDENGKPVKRLLNMFSEIDTPVMDKKTTVRMRVNEDDDELTEVKVDRTRGYIDVHLNKDVLWEMFDMNQGYVSHPEDIARIGKVDNMPLMYYLIRHKMLNFKLTKAKVTLEELRDYLGMQKRDANGRITEVKYPRYSQFKSRIIMTALNDIKRVYDAQQIDFYFDMKEVRSRGKSTGNPDYLEFTKVGNKQDSSHRKASTKHLLNFLLEQYPTLDESKLAQFLTAIPDDLWDDFKKYAYNGVPAAVERPHRWDGTHEEFVFYIMEQWIKQHQPKPQPIQQDLFAQETTPGTAEWHSFLASYHGSMAAYVARFSVHAYSDGTLTLKTTKADADAFEHAWPAQPVEVQREFKQALSKAFGRSIAFAYYIA